MARVMAVFGVVAGMMLGLAACEEKKGDGTPRPGAGGKQTPGGAKALKIAVIPKGTTHVFWKSIHAGASKAGKEFGAEIIWKGPLKEDDREEQIKVVEDFSTQGVSGIVLAPLDDTALRSPVADARKGGIPVVIIDSDLKGDDYVSFAATDNRKGGYLGGQLLAKVIGGKGKVVMLRYAEGSASTTNREAGFLDAMKENPDIQVVSSNQYAGATTESAFRQSENLLSTVKNADGTLSIDAIFTPNESSTFGMLRALQDGKLAGKVKFVGFDSSPKLVDALSAGEIQGLVLQDPVNMGYTGVKAMIEHLNGKPVEKRIDTGCQVVTPENMKEPKMQDLLHPALD